ncbi:unnamed protein product [Allacma fusca]|uniref:Carboxylic ester hydrolase n=1 Tax=Allacma fusca TaxID=39272 RepID=A0A8J2J3R8_9HEXA|nr:unnamed protein product [Allacma fusca]
MAMFWLIFALQSLCTYFPCTPTYGDPKPGIRTRPLSTGKSRLGLGSLSERSIHSRSTNYLDELSASIPPDPIVQTFSGKIRGFRMTTIKGRDVAAFTSVPYAEPPLRNLRFRAPVPVKPWDGIRDTVTRLPYCVQLDGGNYYRLRGTEDCLFLSVFTPMLNVNGNSRNLLPVLIYIHGGAFVFGNGNYGPAYLLDKDIVLVSINYRVGPLGFLSTGDEAAPGNFGLKDQALALEWVHENIEFFGGNKSRITLMGQSAGATSVHLHMMSERTMGLFKGAIAHSASAFVFWAIRDVTPSLTTKLGDRFNCPLNNSFHLVDCLREQDSAFLVSEQWNLWHWWVLPGVLFGPVVEQPSEEAILTGLPQDLYKAGKVSKIPLISGVVEDEGQVFGLVFSHVASMRGTLRRKWDSLAPYVFDYATLVNSTQVSTINQKIYDFYIGDGDPQFDHNNKENVHNAFGDRYMVTGVHKGLQYHAAYGPPTYGYYFNYQGRLGLANSLGYRQSEWGVAHGDDLLYLMNNTNWYHPLELNTPEYGVSEFLMNVWTNFVAKGLPYFTNEEGKDIDFWPRISDPYNMTFLEINENPRFVPEPFYDRIKFWEGLNVTTLPDPIALFSSGEAS